MMNRHPLTLILLTLALTLGACNDGSSEAPVAPIPAPPVAPPPEGSVALVTSLKASDKFGVPTDSFTAGEEITLTLEVSNPSDRTVAFQTGQPCDVVTFNALRNNQVLWRSIDDEAACNDVIFRAEVLPGETITFDEVWLGTNDNGSRLGAGSYLIDASADWTFETAGDSVAPPEPLAITLL
ncbi:MAG: BsuPI-related putative proteinase inhibitor [Pseudomonadota bacterium]